MAQYENPVVRDDVNVAPHSAVGEFFRLSLALALGIAALVLSLTLGFRWLAPWIPFHYEQKLAGPIADYLSENNSQAAADSPQAYLQNLANTLAQHMDFPPEMTVRIHWSEEDVPNAFATIGGHITLYRGLINRLSSENALAMVVAHELAHVQHRDPLVSAGSGLVLSSSLGLLLGQGAESIVGKSSAALMQLQFSRNQERDADAAALKALEKHYGHTLGADEFFQAMAQMDSISHQAPEFLQTHPDTAARIAAIAADNARFHAKEFALTALPAWLKSPPSSRISDTATED